MKPRRVAIITTAFPPVGGGGALRMAKLAKYLPEHGWDVTVIRSEEDNVEVPDPDLVAEIPPNVRVRSVSGPFRFLGRRAERLTDAGGSSGLGLARTATQLLKAGARSVLIPDRYVGWAWRVSRLKGTDLGDPEVILSSGPPHSVHLGAVALAKRLRIPLVLDFRDDWVETHMASRRAPWRMPIEARMEARAVRYAARVVHVSEPSAHLLARRYPAYPDRFVAIPNGFDPGDVVDLPTRRPVTGGPTRFLYSGSLRGTQELGRFPEAFASYAEEHPSSLHLRFVGPIEDRFSRALRAAIKPEQLEIQGPVSHREALQAMSASDVLLVFIGGGGAGVNTMTGKIFEYLALRRPILLVGPSGPAAELIDRSGAGVAADPKDRAALAAAILRAVALASDPTFKGASDEVLGRFNRRSLAARWAELLGAASERARVNTSSEDGI